MGDFDFEISQLTRQLLNTRVALDRQPKNKTLLEALDSIVAERARIGNARATFANEFEPPVSDTMKTIRKYGTTLIPR